jgi:hypothetical protein
VIRSRNEALVISHEVRRDERSDDRRLTENTTGCEHREPEWDLEPIEIKNVYDICIPLIGDGEASAKRHRRPGPTFWISDGPYSEPVMLEKSVMRALIEILRYETDGVTSIREILREEVHPLDVMAASLDVK